MIRTAQEKDTDELKQLWKNGFHDGDEFVDFYFGGRYKSAYTLCYESETDIEAAAQVFPYQMRYGEVELPSTYILGVVTHENHRRAGRAGALMAYSLQDQYERGIVATTLIPQHGYLFAYYQKFGFTETFRASKVVYALTDCSPHSIADVHVYDRENRMTEDDFVKLYLFYHDMYKLNFHTLLKSMDDFRFAVEEFLLFEGSLCVAFASGNVKGCAFLAKETEQQSIKEFLYTDTETRDALLKQARDVTGQKEIHAWVPQSIDSTPPSQPMGMTRIVNAKKMLDVVAPYMQGSITLNITDEIVKENNGVYKIENGCVTRLAEGMSGAYDMDMQTLTHALFHKDTVITKQFQIKDTTNGSAKSFDCYMNLMLN